MIRAGSPVCGEPSWWRYRMYVHPSKPGVWSLRKYGYAAPPSDGGLEVLFPDGELAQVRREPCGEQVRRFDVVPVGGDEEFLSHQFHPFERSPCAGREQPRVAIENRQDLFLVDGVEGDDHLGDIQCRQPFEPAFETCRRRPGPEPPRRSGRRSGARLRTSGGEVPSSRSAIQEMLPPGIQPSAHSTIASMARSRPAAPNSTGIEPCAGFGHDQLRSRLACRPWYSASVSVHSARISSTCSRTIARRSLHVASMVDQLIGVPAVPHAECEAPSGQAVERREGLGQGDRVVLGRKRGAGGDLH